MKAKKQEEKVANAMEYARIGEIFHAPWNPRTPEELGADHPAMKELVASVMAVGVIQPIAVWTDSEAVRMAPADGVKRVLGLCIAGNRRLEAARIAGHLTIPIVRFEGITLEKAQSITRTENECRFGVSPLLDAKLIGELKESGKNQAEIAALLGTSEAKVCRRAKLLELVPEALEKIKPDRAEIRALELLAAYPEKIQTAIVKRMVVMPESRITVGEVRQHAARLTKSIDRTSWVFGGEGGKERWSRCCMCGKCSGNQADLFDIAGVQADDGGERRTLGQCFDAKCYAHMESLRKDEMLAEAVRVSGGTDADKENAEDWGKWRYKAHGISISNKKTKSKNVPYVEWEPWMTAWSVYWGPAPAKIREAAAKAKAKEDLTEKKAQANQAEIQRLAKLAEAAVEKFHNTLFLELGTEEESRQHIREVLKQMKDGDVREMLAMVIWTYLEDSYWENDAAIALWASERIKLRDPMTAEEKAALADARTFS